MLRRGRSIAPALIVLLALGDLPGQTEPPLKTDADAFADKIARIHAISQAPPGAERAPVRTVLTEAEVNAYLFWNEAVLPSGLTSPHLRLGEGGRVSADAVIDLTVIRNQRPRGWLDPLAYVAGRVAVTASGVIRGAGGRATVDLLDATLAGISVPRSVVQELVAYYTRSPEFPNGVSLDDPIPMPAGIQDLVVAHGEAVVVQ